MFTGKLYPIRDIENFGKWDEDTKRDGVLVEVRREDFPDKANRHRYAVIVGNLFECHKIYQVDGLGAAQGVLDFLAEHFAGGFHFDCD